ncbi:hypothetical protein LTS15_008411 [Exophiala xenobiotica]|nr:hypothetical protein LTS15_008411 [Exophiala xenobiotica]
MEMTHTLVNTIWRPSFVLKESQLRDRLLRSPGCAGPISWPDSAQNPKNRPDSLDCGHSRWRIDGATGCGTRFFAVPLDLFPGVVPLQIFVYLPDQGDYPPALRTCLDSALSVSLRNGPAIADLGIAKHICRALDYQCERDRGFLHHHQSLPFGSKLVFENVAADVANMRLAVVPNYKLESKSRSIPSLQALWGQDMTPEGWPPAIEITSLRLVRQIHDTVSIVTVDGLQSDTEAVWDVQRVSPPTFVFKAGMDSFDHLYHELHFLLSAGAHPHLMQRPLALVVKQNAFGGKRGVVGFVLRHCTGGSIRDILPARQRAGTLTSTVKLDWCRQVTAALLYTFETAKTFFSDLRPDNVLLDHAHDGRERLVLCDFEQRGNWHEWSAPEVLYRQYAENIRKTLQEGDFTLSMSFKSRLDDILDAYSTPHGPDSGAYSSTELPVQAANRAWFALSSAAREKAMVWSLGLFIYVVFEGLSNVQCNIANQWPYNPDVEFPQFKRTPAAIRKIVRRCVSESEPMCNGFSLPTRSERVVGVGGVLFPEGQLDLECGTHQTAELLLETASRWWHTELRRAEKFTESEEWRTRCFGHTRPTLRQVMQELERAADALDRDELSRPQCA